MWCSSFAAPPPLTGQVARILKPLRLHVIHVRLLQPFLFVFLCERNL
jgi:hypothetical protein